MPKRISGERRGSSRPSEPPRQQTQRETFLVTVLEQCRQQESPERENGHADPPVNTVKNADSNVQTMRSRPAAIRTTREHAEESLGRAALSQQEPREREERDGGQRGIGAKAVGLDQDGRRRDLLREEQQCRGAAEHREDRRPEHGRDQDRAERGHVSGVTRPAGAYATTRHGGTREREDAAPPPRRRLPRQPHRDQANASAGRAAPSRPAGEGDLGARPHTPMHELHGTDAQQRADGGCHRVGEQARHRLCRTFGIRAPVASARSRRWRAASDAPRKRDPQREVLNERIDPEMPWCRAVAATPRPWAAGTSRPGQCQPRVPPSGGGQRRSVSGARRARRDEQVRRVALG